MGRITQVHRAIDSTTRYIKDLFYAYNLDGSVKSLTYPSGRVVNSTYDSAGHVLSAIDANGTQYASNATYWPNGALYQQWSPHIYQRTDLNNRLQIGRSYADNGLVTAFYFDKSYTYGAQNNGNILSIVNNKDATRTQSFTYDPLNRLGSAQNAGTDCTQLLPDGHTKFWGNNYGYDAWGNLLQEVTTKCSAENLSVTANANNQLVGNSYDAAGNMTGDGLHNYTYDAGDLLKTVGTTTYWYDADGQRFQKWLNGSGSKTYWYGVGGEVLAEGDAAGHLTSEYVFFGGKRVSRVDIPSGAVQYYLSDHLGSTSMVVSAAGAIENESEYYPWGRERQFSSSDSNHYKFTGKERDSESGLDYFGARYNSSQYGRFMTPDPIFFQASMLTDPQEFNLYAYVRNNPLSLVDPTGEAIELRCQGNDLDICDDERHTQLQALQAAVGAKAEAYLYENKVETTDANGNKTTSYYVGIYTNGPDGKGPSFESINSVSQAIGDIIHDSRVAELDIVSASQPLTTARGGSFTLGAVPNGSPGATYVGSDGKWHVSILDTSLSSPGTLPPDSMYPSQPGEINTGTLAGHEFGHLRYEWGGFWRQSFDTSEGSARRLENDRHWAVYANKESRALGLDSALNDELGDRQSWLPT